MRFKFLFTIVMISMVMISCDSRERVPAPEAGQSMADPHQQAGSSAHKVRIDEVIQAKTYTYLQVTEGDMEYWIATAKAPIEKGMVMFYDQGLEMRDFTSKEIDRTFESIWFVDQLRGQSSAALQKKSGAPNVAAKDVSVEKLSGGVSVQDLYTNMSGFSGKTVKIKGQVTKFNASIMGRNWVHLQDGTAEGDYFDVTITTKDVVKVGDVVVFEGVVGLNKDFGAGYTYELIIEEASQVVAG